MTSTVREVAAFEDTVNQDATLAPKGHLVRPAYVLVNRGDTVKWVNCTNEGLKLLVSGLSIEATSGQGQDLSIQIPPNAIAGAYDYDLTTSSTNKPFKGESKPEIIVK